MLLNPGPVLVDDRVRAALIGPDECHREPEFAALMTRVRAKVTAICGGGDLGPDGVPEHTSVVLTGSGTAALESVLASVIPAGGTLLALDNGHYGTRLADIAAAHAIPVIRAGFGWAVPIDPATVDRLLAAHPAVTHVGLVHHETSTGMLNPVAPIAEVVAAHGRSLVLDAISSVGGEPLDVVADRVDWLVGSSNKCLEGLPGLSFVCGRAAAFEELAGLPARSFYLDLNRHYRAQQHHRAPAFTPAVQVLHAFDTALDLAATETPTGRHRRYTALARRLRSGLVGLGLRMLLPAEHRAATLTAVHLPPGLGYPELHDRLRARGFVIYASQDALAGATFRLATMGQLGVSEIEGFLDALRDVLHAAGIAAGVATGAGPDGGGVGNDASRSAGPRHG